MKEDVKFYQVQLFGKGKIEIFQNVFWHKVHGDPYSIALHYSSLMCTGSYSISTRPLP